MKNPTTHNRFSKKTVDAGIGLCDYLIRENLDMVVGVRSWAARKNLREGIRKMEKVMSPAAQVRREFQLGRPPRPLPDGQIPQRMHPTVTWQRATEALEDFRSRMSAVKLNPKHAQAAIVYVERRDPDQPLLLPLENRMAALRVLAREDVIELGMLFAQIDEQTKQKAIFPYLFYGLNPRGMAVLKQAAQTEYTLGELLENVN